MSGFIGSMLIAIAGIVLYNLAQKFQPLEVHPFLILAIAYAVAMIISLLIYLAVPWGMSSWKLSLVPAMYLGVAVVVTELGFLLIYRSGWEINVGSVFSTIAAAIVLIPIGTVFLNERLSVINVIGALLCLAGLVLTVKR